MIYAKGDSTLGEDGDGTAYGDTDEQFEDCAALGVEVIRQHGKVDLRWGLLAGEDTPVPVDEQDVRDAINSSENQDRVADLLKYARDAGIDLIFTLITLGGGGSITTYTAEYDGVFVKNMPHPTRVEAYS